MFSDRRDAGRRLAKRLVALRREDPVVVSLPYGALFVADEIADHLQAPLRLLLARPLRAPASPAVVGAVSENRGIALDLSAGIAREELEEQVALESVELYRRSSVLRRWSPPVAVVRRTVILVDDGASRPTVVHAALAALRAERPGRIVFATPIAAGEQAERLRPVVQEVVTLKTVTSPLFAPDHYESFEAIGDDAVQEILRERGT